MKQGSLIILLAALLAGWIVPVYAQGPEPGKAQPAAAAAPSAPPVTTAPVRAQLSIGKEGAGFNVELVGRKGNDIYYRGQGASQAEGYMNVNLKNIVRSKFEFKYDEQEVFKCANERRWADAANIIIKVIAPAIPYMDFSSNNVVEPALEAAGYLLKAGMNSQQMGGESNEKLAAAFYTQASKILQQAGRLSWFEGAYTAQLKSIQCLTMMGKVDSAADELNKMVVCEEVYDNNYGLYWLVQATILYKQKSYYEALEAAIKSLVFQNKDTETFPDALLLSANCYYDVQEMHRARDVYYEIIRLFDHTDWSAVARKQLAIIMKNNLTKGKEMASSFEVFVGGKEDMNKLCEEYLKATEKESELNATTTIKSKEENKTP